MNITTNTLLMTGANFGMWSRPASSLNQQNDEAYLRANSRIVGHSDIVTSLAGKCPDKPSLGRNSEIGSLGSQGLFGECIGDVLLVETASPFDDLLTTRILLIQPSTWGQPFK